MIVNETVDDNSSKMTSNTDPVGGVYWRHDPGHLGSTVI